MHLRKRKYNASGSPSSKSDVVYDLKSEKRRKIVVGKMIDGAANTSSRPHLSAINLVPGNNNSLPASESSIGEGTGSQLEFKSREDVEKLLAEKPMPRSKNDMKGRMEEMRDRIKKLESCIQWYLELEDRYIVDLDNLHTTLESEKQSHFDIVDDMGCKINNLTLLNEEYQRQIKKIEDQSLALQEYIKSLQQYNSNLHHEVSKNLDTILELQKDKTTMIETLSELRDQSSLLKNKNDSIKMRIIMKFLSTRELILEVKSSDTIASIKVQIKNLQGIPLKESRLIFEGKQLEDSRTVAECNIYEMCTIFHLLRLCGC